MFPEIKDEGKWPVGAHLEIRLRFALNMLNESLMKGINHVHHFAHEDLHDGKQLNRGYEVKQV
jgi:hypothetical protein